MKKARIILIAMLCCATLNMSAQKQKVKKQTFEEKVSKFWKKTKKELEQAGHEFGDAIGFEDRIDAKADLVKINGSFYMPLYSKDLYKGDSAVAFRTECTKLFKDKYPHAQIQSVAIPQTEWLLKPFEQDDVIVGYEQNLHCFIIARDGEEGYINAKFTYTQYKKVGQLYHKVKDSWPKWERTDVLTPQIYEQLLNR